MKAIPKIWSGQEAWIIGGGPSIIDTFHIPNRVVSMVRGHKLPLSAYSRYMKSIHDKNVIGVNAAFMLGDWVDVCFFGDAGFYLNHREKLKNFKGAKFTVPFANPYEEDGIHVINMYKGDTGITLDANTICWNYSSGAAAIGLAHKLGATRIILLGFDMDMTADGKFQHWHNEYRLPEQEHKKDTLEAEVFSHHRPVFYSIASHAKAYGIEIFNANMNSTIDWIEKKPIEELL